MSMTDKKSTRDPKNIADAGGDEKKLEVKVTEDKDKSKKILIAISGIIK